MRTTLKPPKIGPVGQRVAENVKVLRGRVPLRELSARLTELGRPILPSGIVKIEQGERGVDVDDLVALAEVLDVSPLALLLPNAGQVAFDVFLDLEERDVSPPVVRGVLDLVENHGVTLPALFDYLNLAYRMRTVFAPVVARRKKGK